ncbi:hypothetical protein F9K94_21795 [Brucella tritici]|uniref:Uncharacterized protein n=1 Tax=Brucella tritici TaxID=94626 RepID=A0A7V7VR94_9HYPH|nr:hypothetical protein [Brucella tritici]KAB2655188.1 hypothetical protein F9K94_21795 [Brucella tritici]
MISLTLEIVNNRCFEISKTNRHGDHASDHNFHTSSSRQQNTPHNNFQKARFSGVKTPSSSPATFMKRFQEDIIRSNLAKACKQARRKNSNREVSPEAEYFIEQSRIQRELIKERLENGYDRRGWKELSGHQVAPVSEMGLRSQTLNSQAAKLFVAAVPKGKDLRSNWGKGALAKIGVKLLSLDEPYVEGNRKFLSFIRIDTDRVWDSFEQCVDFFRQLAHDGKIASEPHFLVGLRLPNGQYVRPHAVWMLPYRSAVWHEPAKAGFNRAPVDLFHSVYYGLCNALLDAGADAGAPAASQQVKNPLSPEWFTVCPQDSHFPDLSEHAEYLELGHNRENLTRRSAAVQSGMDIEQSNGLFNYLQKAAYSIMSIWHFAGDPEFARNRSEGRLGAISDRLHIELERAVAQSDHRPSKKDGNVQYLIASVANYAVSKWNPDKLDKAGRNKGAALHLVQGMKSVTDRMAAGGKYAAQKNSDRVVDAITTSIQKLTADGVELTKSTVARMAAVSRSSVQKHWDHAIALVQRANVCLKQGMIKSLSHNTDMFKNQNIPQRSNIQPPVVANHASEAVDIKGKPEPSNQIEVRKTHRSSATATKIRNHELDVIDRSDNDGMPVTRPGKRFFQMHREVAETVSAKLMLR